MRCASLLALFRVGVSAVLDAPRGCHTEYRSAKTIALGFTALSLAVAALVPAQAQQVTGVPGSPSATTTIDGKVLPPAPPPFGGEINLQASQSKPYWPPQVVPPKGAPNILLIMTDDQGYGVSGTFGGVIPTPALDRIAQMGLRYTQFHSTALCSPTRAALITGQSPLGGFWHHLRTVDRLSRL